MHDRPAEVTFLVGALERRAADLLAFAEALGGLCRGALQDCDLGASSAADHVVCLARLRGPATDATRRRLAFWAWRIGGTAAFDDPGGRALLDACDRALRQVSPAALADAVRGMVGRFLDPSAPRAPEGLALRLALGTPAAAGLAFDAARRVLFVPSPRLPPNGELIPLDVRAPDSQPMRGAGMVIQHQPAGRRGPGTPGGFLLQLAAPGTPLVRALQAHAADTPSRRRRAPRYPVRALATVTSEARGGAPAPTPSPDRATPAPRAAPAGAPAIVENVSQGGAFLRTGLAAPSGTRIRLGLNLPGGQLAGVPGTVVREGPGGVAVRFDPDPAGEAAIGSALEHVAARRRRALVVDDDALARRMMGDALAGQGFEVFAAADGREGIRTLIDVLLDLDLVVVDLHMPGLDGERLIRLVREAGGERDLTIVAMTGDAEPAAARRLAAAGADAVVTKAEGMERIAEAGVRLLLRREWCSRALDGAAARAATWVPAQEAG